MPVPGELLLAVIFGPRKNGGMGGERGDPSLGAGETHAEHRCPSVASPLPPGPRLCLPQPHTSTAQPMWPTVLSVGPLEIISHRR